MYLRHTLAFLTLALGMSFTAAPAFAQGKKSDSVVKATAKADKIADGKQTVTVTIEIEKGWHVYCNPVGNEDFDSNKTTVIVGGGKVKPEAVKVEYPAGEVVKDSVTGDYKIYKDKVTIKAHVQRASGDTGELEVTLKLQACSKSTCLLPATIKVPVK